MSARFVQYFTVNGNVDRIMEQADRIMESLLQLEQVDPSITDSSVSVEDTRVVVELYSRDQGREDDMVARVTDAMAMAGIHIRETQRIVELVD